MLWVAAAACLAAPPAKAGFVGYYDLANFSLWNTNTDGTAAPVGGLSVILTGGNNGSGLPGSMELVITSPEEGIVRFAYRYSSLDAPGYDAAGYLFGNAYWLLGDADGQSGTVSFRVRAGQRFGFWLDTFDNTGEPGILTISDFEAPSAAAAGTPEPRMFPAVLLFAAAIVWIRRRKAHRVERGAEA